MHVYNSTSLLSGLIKHIKQAHLRVGSKLTDVIQKADIY